MPSPEPKSPNPPPKADSRPASRRQWWPLALIAALLVIGVVLVAVFLNPGAAPQPQSAPTTSTSSPPTPAPDKPLPPAPPVEYYKQIGPPAGSTLNAVEPLTVKVSNELEGNSLPAGLTGISLEATDLGDQDLSADNASMVSLLSDLDKPVLRFGGNSVDRRFWWTSKGEAIPANYKGDASRPVRAIVPADLTRLNGLLQATGARVSLTVDLGHYDPDRAADMMKHATAILGDRLVSVTIGNEPNGFVFNDVKTGSGYSLEQYVRELRAYADAIYKVAPNLPVAGPGVYDQKWWKPFLDADLPQKKIFTFHNYPQHSCDGKEPEATPTIANMLGQQVRDRAANYQQAALKAGNDANVETWLAETGIAACPGSNETSKTHASALWTADYALNAARLGIKQVGFHSSMLACKGGPPMSVLCSAGAYPEGNGQMSARANFFGMAILTGLETGQFLKLEESGGGLVHSHALKQADGSTSVVIVNENDPEKTAQTEVTIELPARALTGTMSQLTGPSYAAQDATLIDGTTAKPAATDTRLTVPGFAYGSATQKIQLTAGTVTVLNFTH
jgi:Glycosyl hydrolase family 79, N-terminal domain